MKFIDVSEIVEPEHLPCCPICDNAIMQGEETAIGVCAGAKALVHLWCCEDLMDGE